ncbi:hypothetical protein AH156_19625 [Salmonella enterica subsp. enterica serovar Enteritidis]|nr:hypothetical protein [Salmonella enterica subsp. enterica serovar Enteritidis]
MPKVIRLTPIYGTNKINGFVFTEIPGTDHYLSEELPQADYDAFLQLPESFVPFEESKAEEPPAAKPAPAAKKKAPAKAAKE